MKILFYLFLLFLPCAASAQTLHGSIYGRAADKLQPLSGALVAAPASGFAVYSDSTGHFEMTVAPNDSVVYVSFMGFAGDTITVKGKSQLNVTLDQAVNLKEVTVKGRRDETFISTLNTHKTEVISTEGLQKNACCSLAESFESNPSVDATTSDAVTGSKQIQMLGLSGTYVQMQTDLLPGIRGLNVITGLSDLPGPFVESIHIRKGPGSVANGYDAITGQIDVEMVKPLKADKLFVNGYADSDSRMELNAYTRNDIGKWAALTMAHGSRLGQVTDMNGDAFQDKPTFERLAFVHRWQHLSEMGKNTELGVKWNYSDAETGNIDAHLEDRNLPSAYFVRDFNNRQEVFGKTCLALDHNHGNELGLQFTGVHHERNMSFGHSRYDAEELTGYANALFQLLSRNNKHTYRFGASSFFSRYTEILQHNVTNDSTDFANDLTYDLSRDDVIPGVFAEYTYDNLKKFSVIVGLRGDYTPTKAVIPTPRLHMRYKFLDNLVLRVSAGTGWRMPHPVAENLHFMMSTRTVVFNEAINPEQAVNYGMNLTHAFTLGGNDGDWSLDIYRTDFIEQTIVDVDRSPYELHFSNLHGKSYSNSAQVQVKQEVFDGLVLMAAAKWNDARTTYNGQLLRKPFSPEWRGLFNAAYVFLNERVKLDATAQYVGPQRVPDVSDKVHHGWSLQSKPYWKVLAQATYQRPMWEVYVGGENLTGFMQHDPVIGAGQPFGPSFDAAMIWGPVTGPMAYAGFRFKLLNK